jgi:hypothetical protein
MWAHSQSPSSSFSATEGFSQSSFPVRFAVAGGRILGFEAYLAGFRDDGRGIAWDFAPPFALGLAGIGPGMKTSRSWDDRTVTLDLWDWSRWLHVEMSAPADTFVPISGPLAKGFAPGLCRESFQAQFIIVLRQRCLGFSGLAFGSNWGWREVGRYTVQEGALEFGGTYVGPTDRRSKVHGER